MQIKNILKSLNLVKALRYILLAVCICVFLYSSFMIVSKLYGYYHDSRQYDKLRSQVSSNHPADAFSTGNDTQTAGSANDNVLPYTTINGNISELNEDGIFSSYADLKKQNDQMVGWIQVPGFKTPVDYPVMQAKDNEFYLKNDFYKNFSYAGSIFMDHRNNASQVDRHIILYGHAMNNLSMFGNLKEFPNRPDDYKKIRKIYLDFMNTRLEYEIFSTYYENASYNYRKLDFSSDDEYMSFLDSIRSKSVYDFNVKLTARDKIITLSTCNNNLAGDMRSVTHARLVRQIVYNADSGITTEGAISTGGAISGADGSPSADKGIVSANNYLSELSLNYGDRKKPQKAVFTPPFSTDVNSVHKVFSTELPSEVGTVFLSYKTADPKATVSVTLNDKKADPSSIKLENGQNVIKITVISRDKLYKRVHTINVTRMAGSATGAAIQVTTDGAVKTGSETTTDAAVKTGSETTTDAAVKTGSETTTDAAVKTGSETTTDAAVGSETTTD